MTQVPAAPHLGRAAVRGGVWGVAGEASSRAAQSICFFVLASVLSPRNFGAAAVAFVCVQVANSLTYAGIGAATQLLGPDPRRDRTAVGMATVTGLLGGLALYALASPLCRLLDTPEATDLVRLVALAIPFAQVSEVMSALLSRELRFRATGIAVVLASIISAAVGLWMAASGAGAAALVAQGVVQPGARLVCLAVIRPSLLRMALHRTEVRQLWSAGRELLLGQVFMTASGNVDNIAVSALAGPGALGGYGFAYNLTTLPFFLVGIALTRVALPIYAALRARAESLGSAFLNVLEATSWLAALPLGYLAVAGPDALVVVFGHKWDPVAWALRVLAVHGFLRTVESASAAVLVSMDRSGVMRRVQQWQLLGVLLLLGPLVLLEGPLGAALAVLAAVLAGTWYSMRAAVTCSGSPAGTALVRVIQAAAGGAAAGGTGLVVLHLVPGPAGLFLSLLAAVTACLVLVTALRPASVKQGARLLRRAQPDAEAPVSTASGLESQRDGDKR